MIQKKNRCLTASSSQGSPYPCIRSTSTSSDHREITRPFSETFLRLAALVIRVGAALAGFSAPRRRHPFRLQNIVQLLATQQPQPGGFECRSRHPPAPAVPPEDRVPDAASRPGAPVKWDGLFLFQGKCHLGLSGLTIGSTTENFLWGGVEGMNGYNRSYFHSLKVIKQLVILYGYSLITGVIGMPLVIPFRSWSSCSPLFWRGSEIAEDNSVSSATL